jgi:hypothetical protein
LVSGSRDTVLSMPFSDRVHALSEEELDALTAAATWYANYASRDIVEQADDVSAYAVEQRRSYLALVDGLRKLGVMVAVPEALEPTELRAA